MVAAGTRVEFHVSGRTGGYAPVNASDVKQGAAEWLGAFFDVDHVDVVRPGVLAVLDPSQWLYWDYTATVIARPRSDYGEIDDLNKLVAHAFYTVTNAVPIVTAPDYGQPEPGNVIDNPAQAAPGLPQIGANVGDALANALKPVTDLLENAGLLIVVGLVVIVALVAFSPTGKALGGRV